MDGYPPSPLATTHEDKINSTQFQGCTEFIADEESGRHNFKCIKNTDTKPLQG